MSGRGFRIACCIWVFLWSWLGVAPGVAGQDSKLVAAIAGIQEAIRKSGADVGVAFRTLDGKTEWFFGRMTRFMLPAL